MVCICVIVSAGRVSPERESVGWPARDSWAQSPRRNLTSSECIPYWLLSVLVTALFWVSVCSSSFCKTFKT